VLVGGLDHHRAEVPLDGSSDLLGNHGPRQPMVIHAPESAGLTPPDDWGCSTLDAGAGALLDGNVTLMVTWA
jgi:hypothetical protein